MKAEVFVMLFFDDGYEEDVRIARMLYQRNIKATFAITVKNIGKELDENDLVYLAKTGEILSHGVNHVNLVKLLRYSPSLTYSELRDSKIFLEKLLGIHIKGFAYPYGVYNKSLKELIVKAGYEYARSVDLPSIAPRIYDKYAIPVTMVDYRPAILHLFKSLLRLRTKLNTFVLRLLVRYLSSTSHASILKLMLIFLKELTNYVRQYNKVFSVLLVFHSKCFNYESFKVFKTILDYIKENAGILKTLTLGEYTRLIRILNSKEVKV